MSPAAWHQNGLKGGAIADRDGWQRLRRANADLGENPMSSIGDF